MCLNVLVKVLSVTVMSGSPAMVMRLVASAYCVAEKAGSIVRRVLHSGDLGIVDKVKVEHSLSAMMLSVLYLIVLIFSDFTLN